MSDCRWRWSSPGPDSPSPESTSAKKRPGASTPAIPTSATSPAPCSRPLVESGKLRATTDFSAVLDLDTINICVPTPLRKTKDPDMSYIVSSCQEIARYFHAGMLVILESTTYPGTTDELVLPMLRRPGLKVGARFLPVLFAGTRGPRQPEVPDAPTSLKWWAASTPACTQMGRLFYAQALETVVPVSSTQVAEMVKLLENTFRMINIGLVNEIAMMCDRMGINVWEVIDAAATKPFGFMPFYPGPGLGRPLHSHRSLLPVLEDQAGRASKRGSSSWPGYINGQMPHFVVDKVQNALNDAGKPVKGSRIHIMGVAYKRDIDDMRESPALDVMLLLKRLGGIVTYSDPYVPSLRWTAWSWNSAPRESAAEADCVVIVTDHKAFDYPLLVERAPLIVDTRNALKGIAVAQDREAVRKWATEASLPGGQLAGRRAGFQPA